MPWAYLLEATVQLANLVREALEGFSQQGIRNECQQRRIKCRDGWHSFHMGHRL